MRRVHLFLHGKVQSVLFRAFVQEHAQRLGLRGFVRNIDDAVEVVAEGEEDKLDELVQLCRRGPPRASVTKIDVKKEAATDEFATFEIVY